MCRRSSLHPPRPRRNARPRGGTEPAVRQTPRAAGVAGDRGRSRRRGFAMKAITVTPGTPNSARLRDVPKPSLDGVAGGRGVLVRILRVGLDGTDKEINAGQ